MRRELFIFRHGETDWNVAGRMQGGTDIPLNATGRAQAEALRKFFIRHPIDVFVSSDLQRALNTARIARGSSPAPLLVEPRIRETNLGAAEGLTRHELLSQLGPDVLSSWSSPDQPDFRFPGGETKAEHLARFRTGIEELLNRHPDYQKWAVATHGGAMRRFIHYVRPDLLEPVMIPNCTVFRFIADQDKVGSEIHWSSDLKIQV